MCGIMGYSIKPNTLSDVQKAILFTSLSRFNDTRGGDSWGIVRFKKDGFNISRGLGELGNHAIDFCGVNKIVAHTRWATHGSTIIENAHPFEVGEIVGAHNGMIYNHKSLCKKYERNFDVDSQHIFAHLNEGRGLGELAGYGAIEWFNRSTPKRVYLTKLFGGELSIYGIGKGHNDLSGIVWSSSYKHLIKSLHSAGIKNFFRFDVRRGKIYYVENNRLFSIPASTLDLARPVIRKNKIIGFVPNTKKISSYQWLQMRPTQKQVQARVA